MGVAVSARDEDFPTFGFVGERSAGVLACIRRGVSPDGVSVIKFRSCNWIPETPAGRGRPLVAGETPTLRLGLRAGSRYASAV